MEFIVEPHDSDQSLEALTFLALRLQEQIWRSPARKKFNIAFIVDMLLMDYRVAEAISFGRRITNNQDSFEFYAFTRLLEEAVKHYRPHG